MTLRGLALVPLIGLLAAAGACSSDDDSDGGGSAGTAGSGGSGTSGTGGSSAGSGGSGGAAKGDACLNAADQAALEADYGDGGLDECGETRGVSAIATECGIGCITDPDQEACVKTCLAKEVTLSDGCTSCVIASFLCGRDNCTSDCLSDPCAGCDACLCGGNDNGINCLEAYDNCSGLTNTVCQ